MGSRYQREGTGFLGKKVPVADTQNTQYNSRTIQLRSVYDAHLKITGPVTGEIYEWVRAGSVVSVNELDAPEMLTKRIGGRSCCGGSNQEGNALFELVN